MIIKINKCPKCGKENVICKRVEITGPGRALFRCLHCKEKFEKNVDECNVAGDEVIKEKPDK